MRLIQSFLLAFTSRNCNICCTERRSNQFSGYLQSWGARFVFAYMFFISGDTSLGIGRLYMLMAIILCGFGYAEGGVLSRKIGWQVICWALILSLPFMLFLTIFYMPASFQSVSTSSFSRSYLYVFI